jgi:hypothetical protein
MRAGRNVLVGALLCTTAALAVGTIATSTPDELRTAALAAASAHAGSPYALSPSVIDHLATTHGADPVKFRTVGNYVDSATTDLGGPNGVFLDNVRSAGGTVVNGPATMQQGKKIVQALRKGADAATATAGVDLTGAATGVSAMDVARAAVAAYEPSLADRLPAPTPPAPAHVVTVDVGSGEWSGFAGSLADQGITITDQGTAAAFVQRLLDAMTGPGGRAEATEIAKAAVVDGTTGITGSGHFVGIYLAGELVGQVGDAWGV